MSTITIHNVLQCSFCGQISVYAETLNGGCPGCREQQLLAIPTVKYIAKSPSDLSSEMWRLVAECGFYVLKPDRIILLNNEKTCIEWEYTDLHQVQFFLSQFKIKPVKHGKAV
jgi:hypothetical protein